MLLVSKKPILPFYSSTFFTFLILIIFASCQPDSINDLAAEVETASEIRAFPEVDERLWPYFERFETEGKARGFSIDLVAKSISGVIEDLEGEHIAGQCNSYGGFRPNHVIIDSEFWQQSSDLFKEFIIFHELGHCFLDRDHREDADENGRCISIMRSGTEDCRDAYNTVRRTAYIDELFEPNSVN